MCRIIGEFIRSNDLHYATDKLIKIIVKFDEAQRNFVKALLVPSNNVEMEDFCSKMLYKIRYIFSKLGRILNLREQTNKWLEKANERLIKKISKIDPEYVEKMNQKKIKLINIDAHNCKNAKMELLFLYKNVVKNWKNEVDYAILMRKEAPIICCRICEREIVAANIEQHTQLCLKRYHAKKKTSEIDKKFLAICNRITNEISGLTKSKVSSAVIKKRSFLDNSGTNKGLPINSPLINYRNINQLNEKSQTITEQRINTLTPAMPSRSSEMGFNKEEQFAMNKIIRKDLSPKKDNENQQSNTDWQKSFQMRPLTERHRESKLVTKPPLLPKDTTKEEQTPRTAEQQASSIKEDKKEDHPEDKNLELEKKEKQESKEPKQKVKERKKVKIVEPKEKEIDPEKLETNLKAFEQLNQAQANSRTDDKMKSTVSFTPGVNKRRLRRDTNTTIDSFAKPGNALPEVSLTKLAPKQEKKEEEKDKSKRPRIAPLEDFTKPKEDPNEKVKNSLSFLQQLGGAPVKEKKEESKKDMFSIPEFKPKGQDTAMEKKSKSEPVVKKGVSKSTKEVYEVDPIPEFSGASKLTHSNSSSDKEVATAKRLTTTDQEKKTQSQDFKPKNNQVMLGKISKYHKLSVIHEENKTLSEFVPTENIPSSPYLHNCILGEDAGFLYYENKLLESIPQDKDKSTFLSQMVKYNKAVLKDLKDKDTKESKKVSLSELDKPRNCYLILKQQKCHQPLSYVEKQLSSMLANYGKEEVMELVTTSLKKFEGALKLSNIQKKAQEIDQSGNELRGHNSLRDEYSISGYTSENSDSEPYSNSIPSKGAGTVNGSNSATDDSMSNEALSTKRATLKYPSISVNESDSSKTLLPGQRKFSKDYDNIKKRSKFRGNDAFSSKKWYRDFDDKFSSKNLARYDQEIGTFGYLKGGNTVPLVSELLSRGVRNTNTIEVYERLKFFARECYHLTEANSIIFKKILKEINLYLRSYEDDQEDSEWDSDEECASVTIANDLKKAIEERTNLNNEITEVEKDMIAANSNHSKERQKSLNDSDTNTPPLLNKTSSTQETSKLQERNNSVVLENKDSSLYKNVLKRGTNSPQQTKEVNNNSSMVIPNFSDSMQSQDSEENAPGTPKLNSDKSCNQERQPRGISSQLSFHHRSSSIHSMKSSKGSTASKRLKKKKLSK